MKVLVMSDNHHDWKAVERILASESYDFSIHLGDAEVSESKVKLNFDKYVAGNHDFFSIQEDTFDLEGITISILHGHTRGLSVFSSFKESLAFGKETKASLVLHGHTHIVADREEGGIRVICPGSVANPRTLHGCTYMIIELEKGQVKNTELKNV